MSDVDDKIEQLKEMTDKLDSLTFDVLREKVARTLNGFLTYVMEPVVIVSPKGRILDVNSRGKKLFGYPEDDRLIKKDFTSLVPKFSTGTEKMSVFGFMGLKGSQECIPINVTIIPLLIEAELISCVICAEVM